MSKSFLVGLCAAAFLNPALAQSPATPPTALTLFEDVSVFDGKADSLLDRRYVLVRGNLIEKISTERPVLKPDDVVTTINGAGQVLMPGLIDDHWHSMLVAASAEQVVFGDPSLTTLIAGKESTATLMRGFTSVRDMAGAVFGLKKAIDQGLIAGPRIWPSGAIISQTGGHGDFRAEFEIGSPHGSKSSQFVQVGHAVIADGPAEVVRSAREQLMRGASQLKLAAGGGVVSRYDQIDVSEYGLEEMKAAVGAAADWNTYVTVHAYTPRALQTAIQAGVRCIDHGHLMDEATAKMMSEKGVWLSTQPFLVEDLQAEPTEYREKLDMVSKGTDRVYALAKKYKLKTAFGTDIMFNPKGGREQNNLLIKMTRWYTPAEVLRMATGDNAQLLALSGPRNPYPGRLGVIEEGALADILLVKGNPLANIQLLADPQNNLTVIMKDGKIHKNTL